MTSQTQQEIQLCQEFLSRSDISEHERAMAQRGLEDWFCQSVFEDGLMSEHFSKATLETTKFCNRCGRNTQWYVSDGRLGRCKEEHLAKKPKKVAAEEKQKGLFES